jgi:hypothetical protein
MIHSAFQARGKRPFDKLRRTRFAAQNFSGQAWLRVVPRTAQALALSEMAPPSARGSADFSLSLSVTR